MTHKERGTAQTVDARALSPRSSGRLEGVCWACLPFILGKMISSPKKSESSLSLFTNPHVDGKSALTNTPLCCLELGLGGVIYPWILIWSSLPFAHEPMEELKPEHFACAVKGKNPLSKTDSFVRFVAFLSLKPLSHRRRRCERFIKSPQFTVSSFWNVRICCRSLFPHHYKSHAFLFFGTWWDKMIYSAGDGTGPLLQLPTCEKGHTLVLMSRRMLGRAFPAQLNSVCALVCAAWLCVIIVCIKGWLKGILVWVCGWENV